MLRIFGTGMYKGTRLVLRINLGLCIAHGIASVLEVCLICRPLAAQWDPYVGGLCENQTMSFAAIEISGMVLDVAILASPLWPLYNLRIQAAKKVPIVLGFEAGAV